MLAAAVDIKRWLRDDRHTPYIERLNRDRQIGRSLAVAGDNQRLLAWWARISADLDVGPGTGERVVGLRRTATVVLFVVGVALGAGVGGLAFGYQGDYPVNLFTLLGAVVGVPLLLLVVTLLLLPGRIPGFAAAQTALSAMNPARWAGALLDRFADAQLFAAFGGPPANAFARWQLVVFSQWFAVGFFVGVLGMAWLLVAFTDLAFGWSTTLQIQAAEISRLVAAVTAPWSGWLPIAVPDVALVEASRFYRLEEGGMPASRVVALGQWWPFVLVTIIVYGLLPRFALLGIGTWRLRVATRSLLREDAEVTALLDRLDTPRASYEGDAEADMAGPAETLPGTGSMPSDSATSAIVWNEAASDARVGSWLRKHFAIESGKPAAFGVLQSEAQQRVLLDEVEGRVRRLVIFTKGWEPPLLEFSDFLNLLRERLGPEVSIVLVPLDVAGASVQNGDREVWARALSRQRDTRLYVVEAETERVAPR